uniref:Uncharacterized protein n=1 Tax=Schizaphis graminum TaxID=13262 RepID=A0A2S2PCC7_SCHGA
MVNEEDESILLCKEVLNLEDTLRATNETPMDNSIDNQPGTSGTYENTHLWTPLESTKLLRTTEKHKKLAIKKKNHSQTSASEKIIILSEKKQELVELQKTLLKEEHVENMTFLKAKHALELQSLELDIAIKKQKLNKNEF